MTSDAPSEEELHAYVDGRLDDARRQAIAFYLTQHPQRANEVRAWQRDARQLRAALGMLPTEYANPALYPAVRRVRRRNRVRARLAMAAMLVFSMGLGGVGGWQARSVSSAGREPPMSDAMQAYRMFAPRASGALDITAQRRGDLQAWPATRFSHAPTLPDLNAAGVHAAGGRPLALSEGAAAMVLYKNAQGNAISFYIRPPSRFGLLRRGERQDGELMAVYGAGNGYSVAMVSHADGRDSRVARNALDSAI